MNHKELILEVSQDPFLLVMVEDDVLEKLLQRAASQIDAEPMFYGWILAESYVRKWLRSVWDAADLDLSNDNSFSPIKSDLDHTFESSKKFRKGLNYVSDRPNRDEELDRNHPKNYFLSRILDFITCDGIVLVVKRDLENQSGFAIPYKLKSGQASDPQIYDRKDQRLASEDWGSAIVESTKKNSEPLNLHLLASFEKGGEELVGTSFLLSLKVAMWRMEKKVKLHPLEFGITGGLNGQSGEIEMVRSLCRKSECAYSYGAFLFIAPSHRPEAKDQSKEERPMAWINVQNKSLEECLDLIQEQESGMWMERARKLEFSAGKKHSAITFKLVYELDLPSDFDQILINGFRFVEEGEGGHLSKLRINHISNNFLKNLFFRKNEFGKDIPCICELDLTLLKSLDTLRKDTEDPTSKWAKLTAVDFIPFKGKNGVRSAKVGFTFKTIKGQSISFRDYQEFITQRRFGKIAFCKFKEKSHSLSISISQIINQIQKMFSQSLNFDFNEALSIKPFDENQPFVIQYLLSPEEEGAYGDRFWKELTSRPDFRKAFDLVSALSDKNRNIPKTKHRPFQMNESVFTQYALHHRCVTAWSRAEDQFNRETKANQMAKPYSFLILLAEISKEIGLNVEDCDNIFAPNFETRKRFFYECMSHI